MIIDEKGKIFEDIDLLKDLPEGENLDSTSNESNVITDKEEISAKIITEENLEENIDENTNDSTADIISNDEHEQIIDKANKLDTYDNEFTDNISDNENEKSQTNETNCLALTVRKDYNLSIFKNSVIKTFKVTLKVSLCTFFLNLLSLFL